MSGSGEQNDVTPAGEQRPVDRFGEVSDERARDRPGVIAFMARNGVAANIIMIFMIIAGLYSYSTIGQEVFAEQSLDTVSVSVAYPGATPEEVEESIIVRVEQAVEAIEGVKKITSTASEGAGSVNVELEVGTDLASALDEVKSEVDQINTFPLEAEEPNVRELTTRQVLMKIALFGDVPERTLKESAYALEDAISALPDVSYVTTSTVRDYQIFADISQDDLRALNLSLTDVSNIVAQSSLDSPAGSIDTATEEVRIRTVGQNYTQQDFEDIVLLTTGGGAILRLGDVATIEDGFADTDLTARFDNKPVAFVDVYRTSDERVLDVSAAVKTLLTEGYSLPPGVSYAIWDDDSEILDDRLSLLLKNAVLGLILVLVALTLFLDLRLAFWTAIGIGATFIGAIFLLEYAGSSINMFSLFGFILALGLVVDDAVVVGENIYAERERGRSSIGAAIAGAQRVKVPVIFAVLTTVTAFSPLLAIGGSIGKILADIPLVVLAVLILSLVEALLVLPYHLSHLPAAGTVAKNRVTRFFERVQKAVDVRFQQFVEGPLDTALNFTVRAPAIIIAGAVAMLILFVAMVPAGIIKFSFFPDIEADQVTASLEMPSGTTIDRTTAVAERIEQAGERAIERLTGDGSGEDGNRDLLVESTYTTIGLQQVAGGPDGNKDTFSPSIASIQIALSKSDDRTISAVEFENAWREELGDLPEAKSFAISSALLSIGDPVNVQLSHQDEATLDIIRARVMEELASLSGVFDVESDQDAGMREVELRMKPSARTLGVTLQDVAAQVRAAFFGAEALRVQRGREDVRVYVRLPEDERNSIADIEKLRIRLANGFTSVGSIAEASFTEAPSQIRREGGRRIITVTADVNEDVVTGQEVTDLLTADILPKVIADYPSLGYSFGGAQEEQQESFGDLGSAFGLALIIIYALLAIPFRSYTQPLIIMAAIPFGLVGALFGHLVLGIPLGILSMFGIVALSGVIINGSLVLIDFMNENLEAGIPPDEAVIDAAKSRFRPIMLTAITTFLGVAPITFETSIQAQFLIPMSASLGFGVLIGTIQLMLVIPALAVVHMKAKAKVKEWAAGEPDVPQTVTS
ncbi:efflux RND transporter permease subunit [Altererythrobacter sp. RZ02]|uniref:Efflux RND transporter permease subunit n=1 Tax=Pontixanthobacter rizhaonensis TaxID=2730337 RepID=A0A848QM13_9SPHN|nr:efflux RND transporter permease subunit [Pontixanthobacter rizhaonensis]NMW30606.1 efflux RND transporter permease subunit [Pontixanthobacter rizhaonensis]